MLKAAPDKDKKVLAAIEDVARLGHLVGLKPHLTCP
jgi:hypothetical protein